MPSSSRWARRYALGVTISTPNVCLWTTHTTRTCVRYFARHVRFFGRQGSPYRGGKVECVAHRAPHLLGPDPVGERLLDRARTEFLDDVVLCEAVGVGLAELLVHVLPESRESHRHQRSEEHTSELQSRFDLVCRLLLEKKKNKYAHINDRNK